MEEEIKYLPTGRQGCSPGCKPGVKKITQTFFPFLERESLPLREAGGDFFEIYPNKVGGPDSL
ncbi:MAG: hypothetical protein WCA84_14050 [Ignavibacteriaceae bacterium]